MPGDQPFQRGKIKSTILMSKVFSGIPVVLDKVELAVKKGIKQHQVTSCFNCFLNLSLLSSKVRLQT